MLGAEPGECCQLKDRRNKEVSKGNGSHIFQHVKSKAHLSGPRFTRFHSVLPLLLLGRPDP